MQRPNPATPQPRHSATRHPRPRRGAAYLLVLASGMLLAVIGFGILTSSRSASKAAGQNADLDEASILAESALEQAMAVISNNSNWRSLYTSGVEGTPVATGRGTMSIKLVDETDGNLSNNTSDAVRVYGIGRVGSATRIYSVQLTGSGGALDVLNSAAHSDSSINVTDNLTVAGGPLSSNATLAVTSGKTLTGDAKATTISGTVSGSKTTLSSSLSMPAATVFDTYKALATTLAFSSISSGTINKKVIGTGANTSYASAPVASNGVYYVHVPSTGTLTISNSRLLATLVVELDAGGKLVLSSTAFAWDPPRTDYPTLIVKGSSGCTVTLGGSTSQLSELTNLTNFNPAGVPNSSGVTDADTLDSYASEFHGLLHIIGSSVSTTMQSNFALVGAAVSDGPITTSTGVKLTLDPTLASNPPSGYTSGGTMSPTVGSWKWEKGS